MLYVVGIGPGSTDLLTLRAKKVLENAEVVLGHKTYVKRIINVVNPNAEIIESRMGREVERVKLAVELSKHRKVCLVSGGDPTIYGMTSLVLEYMMKNGIDANFEVIPGITAMCSASPQLGCPVSGDHCVLSLSDLLTPWEIIERRLISALLGDFVVVIYNPSSKRRVNNLKKAMELILRFRGDIPIGCVKNVEREGTKVWISSPSKILREIKNGKEKIDMHTILFVASTETVCDSKRMLTPRGYTRKYILKEVGEGAEGAEVIKNVSGARTEEGLRIAKSSAGVVKTILSCPEFSELERFIAERCVVATADLSILSLLRFNRTEDIVAGMKNCSKIVVDIEMVKAGIEGRINKDIVVAAKFGDPKLEKTLVSSGIRRLKNFVEKSFVAIGNSPSALKELCDMIDEGVKPRAIVATPVGFTNAAKAKSELMKKKLPWIVVEGVRGGSSLCVAIVNAIYCLAENASKKS